ncbi:MAG: hypothetical protein GC185_09240 [Alphaproteobacteria bacterium]|nr:hypothetical protein [Alphaproteobacteria bacterium]
MKEPEPASNEDGQERRAPVLSRIGTALARLLIAFFACLILAGIALAATAPDLSRLPPLRNGDIIFRSASGMGDLPIMLASQSFIAHTGIVMITPKGKITVVGAGSTVGERSLGPWIDRAFGRRIVIARVKNLPKEKARRALEWAKKQYGKRYDFFYLPDEKQFYCSELVYDAFKEGAGVTLGRMTPVASLPHVDSTPVQTLIRQRWRRDPLCAGQKGMTFEKCRARIMAQKLITPASIARDPKLEVIYSNYPGFSP